MWVIGTAFEVFVGGGETLAHLKLGVYIWGLLGLLGRGTRGFGVEVDQRWSKSVDSR